MALAAFCEVSIIATRPSGAEDAALERAGIELAAIQDDRRSEKRRRDIDLIVRVDFVSQAGSPPAAIVLSFGVFDKAERSRSAAGGNRMADGQPQPAFRPGHRPMSALFRICPGKGECQLMLARPYADVPENA